MLPALRLRSARRRTPRLRAVAVPRASAQRSIQPDFLNALALRRQDIPGASDISASCRFPCPPSLSLSGRRPGCPWCPESIRASRLSDAPVPSANLRWDKRRHATGIDLPSKATATTIALMRSFRPVSSTTRTSGLSSGRLPITRLAIARRDSALSILSLAMNRCIPRSTVAGFSANGSFLAAALMPHPSSLAIPTLKAASALVWGFDRCGMFFRISSVHWRNTVCWLAERTHWGL